MLTCRPEIIFEQLEERIVLDGAVEQSSGTWTGPTPGAGIFDGDFHVIEGSAFVFLEGLGAGTGIGYWWNPDIKTWGWAFDYESGWWWENRGSGWDWMNVGVWDFEMFANRGACVFDGEIHTDHLGVYFAYNQAYDEIFYNAPGFGYMKYELGSDDDASWGWWWWDESQGQGGWKEWEDAGGNPYAFRTSSYCGYSAEFLYDSQWRPLPGGHGEDWVFYGETAGIGQSGAYYFWLDRGLDFILDYTSGAGATGEFQYLGSTGFDGMTDDWTYIGDSMFVFQGPGAGGVDQQWLAYDGSKGVDHEWFTYECYSWDSGAGLGAWDFNGGIDLAFLSGHASGEGGAYSENQQYLKENVVGIVGDAYDAATLDEIVGMMQTISNSQGGIFFSTVMFHGEWADTDANAFALGGSAISAANVASYQAAFQEMSGLMLGNGSVGQVHIMNSDTAANDTLRGVLSTIQGYLDGYGPWGAANSPCLWASYDRSGDWTGTVGTEANWHLEWSHAAFDIDSPHDNSLPLSQMLYDNPYTAGGVTDLNGDKPKNPGMIEDNNAGAESASPGYLTELGGYLYFSAHNPTDGMALMRYDPDTRLIEAVWTHFVGNPQEIIALDGSLYFSAADSIHGRELWRYDPFTGVAEMVANINEGDAYSNPGSLTVLNGVLYFRANDGVHGAELWQYDPDSGSAELVIDINPNDGHAAPGHIVTLNGKLYFQANDGVHDKELWFYDPVSDTADIVADINPDGRGFGGMAIVHDGVLYFNGDDGVHGSELWKYDPNTDMVAMVVDILPDAASSFPGWLTVFDGDLYFYATDGIDNHNIELWRYDFDTSTAEMVEDIWPGTGKSGPQELTPLGGKLYFIADDGVHGYELHVYDPVTDDLEMVADIKPGDGASSPHPIIAFDNALYFSADDGIHGYELWRYDPYA